MEAGTHHKSYTSLMPNQRDIAKALGVNQATISLALRGDSSISVEMQNRVRETAERLGYRQNAYVAALMTHIRSGQKPTEKGVIALLVNAGSEQAWLQNYSYAAYYEGVMRRSSDLGFQVENFFIQAPDMSPPKIDRILHARGIRGVILAPPYPAPRTFALCWERYACVGTGYTQEDQQFDRVANDHHQDVVVACRELSRLGYERIGLCLPEYIFNGRGPRWVAGFLTCQERLPRKLRIPVFAGSPQEGSFQKFQQWRERWRPDVLITLSGYEKEWLDAMHLRVPEDIGLFCLIRPPDSVFAGVEERNDCLGSAALEIVAAKIARNEYGPPPLPRLILIQGRLAEGGSVQATHRDEL